MYKTNYNLSSLCHPQPCLFFVCRQYLISFSPLNSLSVISSQICRRKHSADLYILFAANYINFIMRIDGTGTCDRLLISRSRNKDALDSLLDHAKSEMAKYCDSLHLSFLPDSYLPFLRLFFSRFFIIAFLSAE